MPIAIAFAAWCLFVGLLDNVLKPVLFAKGGADVPVLLIFLGSIGGMIWAGLIGLFIGPVILAVGYQALRAWLADAEAATGQKQNGPG
jgi:predicted PurR-regulated permease PerM